MADPSEVKPEDWDQPEVLPDPSAAQPAEWDEEMDGDWEAPTIKNPEFKVPALPFRVSATACIE